MGMTLLYVMLGLLAGCSAGIFGIGGGIILIPGLLLLGYTQHQAQGTTLALLVPPLGLLAAMRYYKAGNVNLTAAAIICVAFVIGSVFGAEWAQKLSDPILKKLFGIFLLLTSLHLIFSK